MPELPEVETIVRQLRPVIQGKTIQKIVVLWNGSLSGDVNQICREVIGKKISEVRRYGKYICLRLDNSSWLTIHLRMTGKLLYCTAPENQKHVRVVFGLSENCTLHFIDSRKFGRITWWQSGQEVLPDLGPDAVTEAAIYPVLKKLNSSRAIKSILLDQHILAGIGNIYADESLFAAGIHPQTPVNKISLTRLKRLSQSIPQVLQAAIVNQGTTLSDYRSPQNQRGENQYFLKVYSQTGRPCVLCHTPIQKIKVNSRGSHFCPSCQAPKDANTR